MRARPFRPDRLDVDAFATAGGELSGERALTQWPRLADAMRPPADEPDAPVRWSARGERRQPRFGAAQSWLHLGCGARGEMTCQRCLEPVSVALSVERAFRFVDDETAAAQEDDASEEDVLAGSTAFDLVALVEDELVLALPYAPRHDVCPMPRRIGGAMAGETARPTVDSDVDDAASRRPSPFAVLAGLTGRPSAGSDAGAGTASRAAGEDAPPDAEDR